MGPLTPMPQPSRVCAKVTHFIWARVKGLHIGPFYADKICIELKDINRRIFVLPNRNLHHEMNPHCFGLSPRRYRLSCFEFFNCQREWR